MIEDEGLRDPGEQSCEPSEMEYWQQLNIGGAREEEKMKAAGWKLIGNEVNL